MRSTPLEEGRRSACFIEYPVTSFVQMYPIVGALPMAAVNAAIGSSGAALLPPRPPRAPPPRAPAAPPRVPPRPPRVVAASPPAAAGTAGAGGAGTTAGVGGV